MKWERARTEEQKQQRINEIVAATARLYDKQSFEEITFAAIAKEASFTRSNLYKYFNSKEEIFLEFLKHDLADWAGELLKSFDSSQSYSVKEFASIWVDSSLKRKRLIDLVSLLHTFLEKNVSKDHLVDFKRSITVELQAVSDLICKLLPEMTPLKVMRFTNMQMSLASGLYQMTNLTDLQREVLDDPEFEHFKVDFDSHLRDATEYLLRGLLFS